MLFFLLLASFNSYGYWTETHKWYNNGSIYVDFDYLKKQYDGTLFWRYIRNTPNRKNMKSVMYYIEGNCKTGQTRVVTTTLYREIMGQDKILSDSRGYKWDIPKPDNTHSKTLTVVCGFL